MSLRYLYPSVRLHIIEEISREACEAYPNGIEPAAEALGVSLSELQNIIDDANDASSIHNIPHHLQYYKKAYPDTLIDPDMPPSGAVFWACVFLKSQALPLSLVYWYFTDQNIVLSPPQPDPASSLPAIDCTHSARSARTSDETSDSSLEWDPNIEASDLGHRWHVARRTGGYERRKSMNYELGKIPQELLAATVSHPARSASLFTAGGMSEAGTSPIRQSTSVSYKSSSQSGPPNSLPRTDCPGLIQGDARSSIPTPTPMRETVAVQPTTVLQNQLNQQPIPSTTAPNMLRGAPHPIRTSEHSDLAMQLKKAAAQPPHAKQRVAASRSGINSMQEQYYSIVSPRMPAGRQTPDNVSTPSPSKIHDAFSGGPGMMATRSNMPTSGPSLHSPFQHTRTTSSQSPYRSPALPGASLACLPPFPGPPSTDGNAAGFYSGRVHPASGQQGAQTTFGAQFAQPSSNDPFIGPEISGAMGPYLGIPGTKGFFTTSLPHQAGGAVYPSLSPSPMQEMPRTQHREGNSGDLSYSGPTINAGAVHAPSSDMLAPATSAAGGRVDVSSVAQVADLLKKGDHHRRSLRTTRGQRGSEGSNFSKAGS